MRCVCVSWSDCVDDNDDDAGRGNDDVDYSRV